MLFSGIPFLFCFLPVFMILYIIVPRRMKNIALLMGSLFFYAWGEPRYVILMIIQISINYILGLLIEYSYEVKNNKKMAKGYMIISVIFGLGILGYYKYADFFIENFNNITGLNIELLKVALPVGISFYTFQTLSYTIDVYRRQVKAQKNYINLAMYITMFPQLIAGPIVRYTDIKAKLTDREYSMEQIAYGIRRLVIGLFKKVIIANTLGEIVVQYNNTDEKTVIYTWIYAISVSLQLYYDFSGYSDMAIGLGSMLGFDFPENFRHPFEAKSATEFWRKWHITLGSFFRDYLYIPLGGNRVSNIRYIFNILIVWMATGLWHGAAWNFVIWGLYFAVFLIIEKYILKTYLEKTKIVGHIYLCIIVMISFVIFSADNIASGIDTICMMFGHSVALSGIKTLYCIKNYGIIILMAVIGSTHIPISIYMRARKNKYIDKIMDVCEVVAIMLIMVAVTAFLVSGSYNPFLYFRF